MEESNNGHRGRHKSPGDKDVGHRVPFITIPMEGGQVTSGPRTGALKPSLTSAFDLSVLASTDKLFIHRLKTAKSNVPSKVEITDSTGTNPDFLSQIFINRKYIVMDAAGKEVLSAGERVDSASRCWRGMDRRYCMYIFSIDKGELLYTIERQRLRCCSRQPPIQEAVIANTPDFGPNLATSTMQLANGQFIGQLRDSSRGWTPNLHIDDSSYINIINIRGKCGANCCPPLSLNSSKFQLFDRQHTLLGTVEKLVYMRGADVDKNKKQLCFTVNFPPHLEVISNALILGAVLDLNISHFERRCSWDGVVYILLCVWIIIIMICAILLLLWATSVITF